MPRLSDILTGWLRPDGGPRKPAPLAGRTKPAGRAAPRDRGGSASTGARRTAASAASSPDREQLIQHALQIRRAKQGLLEALPDEERFLLKVMANEMMGGGGKPSQPGKDDDAQRPPVNSPQRKPSRSESRPRSRQPRQ